MKKHSSDPSLADSLMKQIKEHLEDMQSQEPGAWVLDHDNQFIRATADDLLEVLIKRLEQMRDLTLDQMKHQHPRLMEELLHIRSR